IPVIPPELRPLVPLDGGRFATSDLNDLYRRVINRNNRLKRLIELRAPDIIVRNEKRMLQEAVDALFDNGRRGRVITGANKRPLKSLSDMLKGKQGRFRQNLLGKRVDYSGRSVIVTGPELKLHQCGLPKKMALELFKPFIYARLDAKGLSMTLKQAKKWVEKERKEVWDILDEVIREHPVLLNRAPTLHRLGIQAFEPVLIEGKAIQLHPLVCAAFNADFDGDQMAVHVPLSLEAQLEARVLRMSTNNILSPANGKPIIVPSQDMVLGLYYLSMDREGEPGEGMILSDMAEVHQALHAKAVTLHSRIISRVPQIDEHGREYMLRVETTPGRMLIGECLPQSHKVPFEVVNRLLTKKEIGDVIDQVYRHTGQKDTVLFADAIMALGFRYAFEAGISFGKDDMIIPKSKTELVEATKALVAEYEQQYQDGLITQQEKYNKVIDAWSKCGDMVADAMMEEIKASPIDPETGRQKPVNSIYMMSHSGARGSPAQMKQLAGMRGLMAKPSGEIIETPIISNFKEGLTVLEYFNSTHGARKGLADTALKTANSGYLTRRLVDVSQDCVVVIEDCGTERALEMRAIVQGGSTIASLGERILGRTLAEDIADKDGNIVAAKGTLLDEATVKAIEQTGVQAARIRSPLVCEAEQGVCATCYGRDLARGTPVNIGEAVGVIAAQSIGEPGTQLTMRTFHIGGAAQVSETSHLETGCDGTVKYRDMPTITDKRGRLLSLARNGEIVVIDADGHEREIHRVPYGTHLLHADGAKVKAGDRLAEWDPFTLPIITETKGVVKYQDLIEGLTMIEQVDEATGIAQRVVTEVRNTGRGKKKEDLRPRLTLLNEAAEETEAARYLLAPGTTLSVEDGQEVEAGDVLARASREAAKTRDITGGLPRVAELFEARRPKDNAIIAKISGRIEFVRDYKAKRKIAIIPEEGEPVEYLIPKSKVIDVQEGDWVKKGDNLISGSPDPHDILEVLGVEALAEYLVSEIQEVYRLQGVKINDKHIEVIVRQMLQKVEITDGGDTTLLVGEQLDRQEMEELNAKLAPGQKPAEGKPVLLGITKASLQTRSFISAASFQETTRVLTQAAVEGKTDSLVGLKENVIVGRLIPAGTGASMNRLRVAASSRDAALRAQYRKMQAALTANEADLEAEAPAMNEDALRQAMMGNAAAEQRADTGE
ncbi:MAG: DNA-directed RNA polymerase subunit beta', partial [Novosphingobium sp.]|nr:DNA-directed RNA polymerase subunit beta' [Novosphingobium sp.]